MPSDEEVRAQLEDDDAAKMAHFYGSGDVGAVGELFERLIAGLALQPGGASLVLSLDESGEWVGLATFGREAEDSPMAGGAVDGMGPLDEVLRVMVEQGRW